MKKILLTLLLFLLLSNSTDAKACNNKETSYINPQSTNQPTTWRFTSDCDIKGIKESLLQWSLDNGYSLHSRKTTSSTLWFQRGTGTLTYPMVLKIEATSPNQYQAEAFLFGNTFNRIMALGIYSQKTKINTGGVKGVVLRAIARKQIQPAIHILGLSPID